MSVNSTAAAPAAAAASSADPASIMRYWKPEVKSFTDRQDAGTKLAAKLVEQYGEEIRGALVLGCVRGGFVVAAAVVEGLRAYSPTLDMVVCRKISHPKNKEYGIGAITQTGEVQFDANSLSRFNLNSNDSEILRQIEEEKQELQRRLTLYRREHSLPLFENKIVVIVDDGMASGGTAKAAVQSVRALANGSQKRIIVAVPVLSEKSRCLLQEHANLDPADICSLECAHYPPGSCWSIDDFYQKFDDVPDEIVCGLFSQSALR